MNKKNSGEEDTEGAMLVVEKMGRLKDESTGVEGGIWVEAPQKMEFVATVALPDLCMGE